LDEPERWLKDSLTRHEARSFETFEPELKVLLVERLRDRLQRIEALADAAVRRLRTDDALQSDEDPKQVERLATIEARLATLFDALHHAAQALDPFDYPRFRERYQVISTIGFLNTLKAKAHPRTNQALDRVKKAYSDGLALLHEETPWFEASLAVRQPLETLSAFVLAYEHTRMELKQRDGVMDFDDMERYALNILKDERFGVAAQLQDLYDEILIDEFQDTNEVQNRIVELISNGRNLFRVGDVKQSIYRFRGAKPQMMIGLMAHANIAQIVLDENYRSRETLVDFNNRLFSRLMNFTTLPQRYRASDRVKIGAPSQQGGVPIEVHLIQSDAEADIHEEPSEDTLDELIEDVDASPKAMHIVSSIQRQLREDPERRYRDFVVLVRSNAQKTLVKDVLEKAQIPHAVTTQTGFHQADAIQDVLHLIQHLQHPQDPVHLVAILSSPYAELSENDIAQLKLSPLGWTQALKTHHPQLSQELDELRAALKGLSPIAYFERILHFRSMHARVSFQDQTNLDALLQQVIAFQARGWGVRRIVDEVLTQKDSDSSEAIISTEEDDVVRVMTIHQAKGLEFHTVYLWSTGRAPIQDVRDAMIIDADLGLSLTHVAYPKRYTLKGPIRVALEMKAIIDDVAEQLRLLYVALTRAQQRLILVDVEPKWVPPLAISTLLSTPGTTALILAAHAQDPLVHIERVLPTRFIERTLDEAASEQAPVFKPSVAAQTLTHQSPSSTHLHRGRLRLNFARSGGVEYGSRVHALFEHLPTHGVMDTDIEALAPELSPEQRASILAFYTDPHYAEAAQGTIHHELAFYARIENRLVHGYMDWVSVGEKVVLVDFKSDQVDDADTLIEAYHEQIDLYRRVLQQRYPNHEVKAFVYSLALHQWIAL
jgi:ATP-dependent helicase/nuclease subunit A